MAQRHAEVVDDCKQEDRLGAVDRDLKRLNETVFFGGNGSQALVTQVSSIQTLMRLLCWMAGGTLMAVIGQIVVALFKAIGK